MNSIGLTSECSLTDLDWSIVGIARTDGVRSINPDGRFARILRDFFGFRVPRGLANERAETLRRFCVRAWHWDLIRARDLRPLVDAGYSRLDVFHILQHVARSRGFVPAMQEGAI